MKMIEDMEIKENVSYLMLDFIINNFKNCIQHCRKRIDKDVTDNSRETMLLLEEFHSYKENLREIKLEIKSFVAKDKKEEDGERRC